MAFAQPAPERTPSGARLSVDVASGSARWSTWLGTALTGSRLGQRKLMALNDLGQSCSPKFPTRWRWSG